MKTRLSWLLASMPLLVPTGLLAQTNNLVTTSPALPDATTAVLRMLGSLVFVVALFLVGAWAFSNWRRFSPVRGPAPKLRVLEARALGNRSAIYVVGYEQQRLLVTSSASGVTLLSHLPPADDAEVQPTAPAPATPFAQALQQMLSRRS